MENFPEYFKSDVREYFGFLGSYDAHRVVDRTVTVCQTLAVYHNHGQENMNKHTQSKISVLRSGSCSSLIQSEVKRNH